MEKGLSTTTATSRLQTIGKNETITTTSHSARTIFLSQFPTFMNGILFVAAIFSLITRDALDAGFIFMIILLNALFGFFQEYKAEKAIEKLKGFTRPVTRVIRDGKEREISTADLVPGDLVIAIEGDRIPADGTILNSHHMEVDEAILTGESLPVMKVNNDALFAGTLIVKGKGLLIVTHTGMKTKLGLIAQTLSGIKPDPTPLQRQISKLGKVISLIALGSALLLLPLGIVQGQSLYPLLLLAISIGIAAVPESMPAVITIALAIGSNRLALKKALIRKMPAVETLGAIQVLLVDKTGTLTQNKMAVKKHWLAHKDFLPPLLQACILGNTAALIRKNEKQVAYDIVGDRTDGALLAFAAQELPDLSHIINEGKVVDEYVFDSGSKTITTVWDSFHKRYVFVRGAPESILAQSIVSSKEQEKVKQVIKEFAEEGMRVIGFGYKTESHHGTLERSHLESRLTFLGLVGIADPPREEVSHALLEARQAGIRTIMVTGDNELTALAIAKEIGLIAKDEDVLTGEELTRLTDDELKEVLTKTSVIARSQPQDKLRITTLLKELGFVVGVTGDGVNDSLALKKADVGIAMGLSGTDVAKEASDIVLADDNFATLIKAVSEGRGIYQNIVKSITYLLSSNLSELLLVILASLFGLPSILLPTQILWINVATDSLPALALATDTTPHNLLKQKPRNPKEPILTRDRLIKITGLGTTIALILVALYSYLLTVLPEAVARTIIFNLLIFSHLILAFIIRGQSIFKINKFLVAGTIIIMLLQLLITGTPYFRELFSLSV